MNARCLACQAGQTIADYCAANEKVVGCENRGRLYRNKLVLFNLSIVKNIGTKIIKKINISYFYLQRTEDAAMP